MVYLITFTDHKIPERQQIEVEIQTRDSNAYIDKPFWEILAIQDMFDVPTGIFGFRVGYTYRTWGADIENLLRDHMESLIQEDSSTFRRFMLKSNKYVRLVFQFIIGVSILEGGIKLLIYSARRATDRFQSIGSPSNDINDLMISKLSYIFSYVSDIAPAFNIFGIIVMITAAGGISIFLADQFVDREHFQMPSFVILTRRSETDRVTKMRKYEKNWRNFICAFAGAIIASVVANIFTVMFFQ